jgi:hypothetical protein
LPFQKKPSQSAASPPFRADAPSRILSYMSSFAGSSSQALVGEVPDVLILGIVLSRLIFKGTLCASA